jgi:hypothetical protein
MAKQPAKKRSPAKRKAKTQKVKAKQHREAVARKERKRKQRLYRIDWNGCPPLPVTRVKLRRRTAAVLNAHPHLYITATTNGDHAAGSYHYLARAVDFGSNYANNGPEKKAYAWLKRIYGYAWAELFGPGNWYVKDGQIAAGQFPGHTDHVHIAV